MTRRWPRLVPVGVVLALFAVPLRGLLIAQGPPMEEGFMLVFPERVLAGDIPNVDFLHLYGPGSLWALAGAYWVFGTSLLTERLFGLAQEVALVLGVLWLARPWGRVAATVCAAISLVLIVPPIGLTAIAWTGAVALGLWALVAGIAAWDGDRRLALLAGVLGGAALLFRPDAVLAVTAGLVAVGWWLTPALRKRLAAGAALGVAPFLIHLATAGVGAVWRGLVVEPVVELRPGRRLPVPPSPDRFDGFLQRADALEPQWPLPAIDLPAQLTAWFFLLLASIALLVFVAVRRRGEPLDRRLAVLAAFSAGLAPQALQRADSTHLAWVSTVAVAFVPLALARLANRPPALAAGVVLAGVLVLIPHYTARGYGELAAGTFGLHRSGWAVRNDGRTFYAGRPDVAADLQPVLEEADRRSEPGDRLFVGPLDLRRTPYVDSFVYFLLPDLEPATYFIEMDPGVADAPGSGMAEDLASADFAILSPRWDGWEEPNESVRLGSDETARVLDERFCPVAGEGTLYVLYERCR